MGATNETGFAKTIAILAGIATIVAVVIAILDWLMPFSPVGSSPLAPSPTASITTNLDFPDVNATIIAIVIQQTLIASQQTPMFPIVEPSMYPTYTPFPTQEQQTIYIPPPIVVVVTPTSVPPTVVPPTAIPTPIPSSTPIPSRDPFTIPGSAVLCDGDDYSGDCEGHSFADQDVCINLGGINDRANSFYFTGEYQGNFDVVFYRDSNCNTYLARYGSAASSFGLINDQFSSIAFYYYK